MTVEFTLRNLHAHYGRSQKRTKKLKNVMRKFDMDYFQPKSLLMIRWVMSKVKALKAVPQDYAGLVMDVKTRTKDNQNSSLVR